MRFFLPSFLILPVPVRFPIGHRGHDGNRMGRDDHLIAYTFIYLLVYSFTYLFIYLFNYLQ